MPLGFMSCRYLGRPGSERSSALGTWHGSSRPVLEIYELLVCFFTAGALTWDARFDLVSRPVMWSHGDLKWDSISHAMYRSNALHLGQSPSRSLAE